MSKTPIPSDMKQQVVDRDGIDCLRCGTGTVRHIDGRVRSNTPAFDHVWPEVLGGPTVVRNLQLLCTGCNRAKGGTHADYRTAPIIGGAWSPTERSTTRTVTAGPYTPPIVSPLWLMLYIVGIFPALYWSGSGAMWVGWVWFFGYWPALFAVLLVWYYIAHRREVAAA